MGAVFDDPEAAKAELPADVLAFVKEVEARYAKANQGPIDVHRYDNDGGSIAYQLQQSGRGEDSVVLCAFDDDDNPKARHDAEFAAKAWVDVPKLCQLLREQLAENAAHRERLAKLESCVVCGAKLLPSDSPPHCEDWCHVSEEHQSDWEMFCRMSKVEFVANPKSKKDR